MKQFTIFLLLLVGSFSQAQNSCSKEALKIASGMGIIEKIEE